MSLSYIPNTYSDRTAMLREIGVNSVQELFQDIPEKFRHVDIRLPPAMSEPELIEEIRHLAALNLNLNEYTCFLGAGSYRHFIPSVIGHLIGRSEFYTAYTPYQAEISQGTLQAMYDYQSLICQLTGMEVSNAGLYDGSTAASEAALMACRITHRKRVAVLKTVNPGYIEVLGTYIRGHDDSLDKIEPQSRSLTSDYSCLIVQQPNFFGYFEDLNLYVQAAHDIGALLIVIVDPISLGMFKPPGDYGADIVVAEGQSLGNPTNFGGPGLGIFACRGDYLRQMPGRIVSRTTDMSGEAGYVLTLQTREQHIRRERATSNICTNESLVALAAAIYLAALGKTGLRHVAELCYHKANYAASEINKLKRFRLVFEAPFFKEFVVRCPISPSEVNKILFAEKIIGGLDISHMIEDSTLLCVTELNTKKQIDKLVHILRRL